MTTLIEFRTWILNADLDDELDISMRPELRQQMKKLRKIVWDKVSSDSPWSGLTPTGHLEELLERTIDTICYKAETPNEDTC